MSRPLRLPKGYADVLLAALAVTTSIIATRQMVPDGGERALDAGAYAAIVVAGGALALRQRRPELVVAVVTAALCFYHAREYVGGPVFATAWLALYSLAAQRELRRAVPVAVASTGVLLAVAFFVGSGRNGWQFLYLGWATAAMFLGAAVRSHRANVAALEDRARQLERSREQEALRRVADERLRIARDLHDSVAHSLATINVQAGAAERVIDRDPLAAREALGVIRRASGEVLEELAGLLGVLRSGSGEPAARAPAPGLADLPGLVASARRGGVDAILDADPALQRAEGLSTPIGVAAYRIVQESLTNVARHAGAGTVAVVTVRRMGTAGLSLEIVDHGGRRPVPTFAPAPAGLPAARSGATEPAGAGPSAPTVPVGGATAAGGGTGVGIVGMQERAEATGGHLVAGSRPEGGFAVVARWPGR